MKKFNIKDQLAGIAALIAAIVAIGGGFAKYGELTTKITALEAAFFGCFFESFQSLRSFDVRGL